MKRHLCRAALAALVLSLALATAAQSKKPVPPPPACYTGKPCVVHADCGCLRCGNFCLEGGCYCEF